MKMFLTTIILSFFTLNSHAVEKQKRDRDQKFEPSVFEVLPLNSPVKESTAKFQLKLPPGFEIDSIKVKFFKPFDLKKDQKSFEPIKLEGFQFSLNVSKLPPGFYQLHVKVKDKKAKEHTYHSRYHDYVRFVIDDSFQVPMPDPVKNNATIAGIDSDNDGIRDDVQRFINEKYPNDQKNKLAAKQFATTLQQVLLTTEDKSQNILLMAQEANAIFCWGSINEENLHQRVSEIEAKTVNTKARAIAFKKADLNFHGQSGSVPNDSSIACEF